MVDYSTKCGLKMEEIRRGCWPSYEVARTGKSAVMLNEVCNVCC